MPNQKLEKLVVLKDEIVTNIYSFQITKHLQRIRACFYIEGYRLWLTGGSIVDLAYGKTPNDFDVVTNASNDEIVRILVHYNLPFVKLGGNNLCTYAVNAPSDAPKGENQPVDIVSMSPSQSIQHVWDIMHALWQNTFNRDFRVNTIFFGLNSWKIWDPHQGVLDLEQQCIRTILPPALCIRKDPSRILRGLQLYASHDMKFEPELIEAIKVYNGLFPTYWGAPGKWTKAWEKLGSRGINPGPLLIKLFHWKKDSFNKNTPVIVDASVFYSNRTALVVEKKITTAIPETKSSTTKPKNLSIIPIPDESVKSKTVEKTKPTKMPLVKKENLTPNPIAFIEEKPTPMIVTAFTPEKNLEISENEARIQESFTLLEKANILLTKKQAALIKNTPALQRVILLLENNDLLSEENIQVIFCEERFIAIVPLLAEHQLLQQFFFDLLQCYVSQELVHQLNQLAQAKILFPASLEILCNNRGEHFPSSRLILLLQKLYNRPVLAWQSILEASKTSVSRLRWLIYLSHCNLLEPTIFQGIEHQDYLSDFTVEEIEKLVVILSGIITKLPKKEYFQSTQLTHQSLVDWLSGDPTGEGFRYILTNMHCTLLPYFDEPYLVLKEEHLLTLRQHIQMLYPYVELIFHGKNSKHADKIISNTRSYLLDRLGEDCPDLNRLFKREGTLSFDNHCLNQLLKIELQPQLLKISNTNLIHYLQLRQKLLQLRLHPMITFELISRIYSTAWVEGYRDEVNSSLVQVLIRPDVCTLLNTDIIESLLNHQEYRSLLTLLQDNKQVLTLESFFNFIETSKTKDAIRVLNHFVNEGENKIISSLKNVDTATRKTRVEIAFSEQELILSRGEYTTVVKQSALYSRLKFPEIEEGILVVFNGSECLSAGHLGLYSTQKNLSMLKSMITGFKKIDNGRVQVELVGGVCPLSFASGSGVLYLKEWIVQELKGAQIPGPYKHDYWRYDLVSLMATASSIVCIIGALNGIPRFTRLLPLQVFCWFYGFFLLSVAGIMTRVLRDYSSTIEIATGKTTTIARTTLSIDSTTQRYKSRPNWNPRFISSSDSSQHDTPIEETISKLPR